MYLFAPMRVIWFRMNQFERLKWWKCFHKDVFVNRAGAWEDFILFTLTTNFDISAMGCSAVCVVAGNVS